MIHFLPFLSVLALANPRAAPFPQFPIISPVSETTKEQPLRTSSIESEKNCALKVNFPVLSPKSSKGLPEGFRTFEWGH